MGDSHMWKDQKAGVVDDQTQTGFTLLARPADERIPGFDFPCRRAKEHAGKIASVSVAHQITKVLAGNPSKAQIMVTRQMRDKGRALLLARLHNDYFKGLQRSERCLDRLRWQIREQVAFALKRRPWNPLPPALLARRQVDLTKAVKLVEQQPRRHVPKLSRWRAPLEDLADRNRNPPPTPARVFGNYRPNAIDIGPLKRAPLNESGGGHPSVLAPRALETS